MIIVLLTSQSIFKQPMNLITSLIFRIFKFLMRPKVNIDIITKCLDIIQNKFIMILIYIIFSYFLNIRYKLHKIFRYSQNYKNQPYFYQLHLLILSRNNYCISFLSPNYFDLTAPVFHSKTLKAANLKQHIDVRSAMLRTLSLQA